MVLVMSVIVAILIGGTFESLINLRLTIGLYGGVALHSCGVGVTNCLGAVGNLWLNCNYVVDNPRGSVEGAGGLHSIAVRSCGNVMEFSALNQALYLGCSVGLSVLPISIHKSI